MTSVLLVWIISSTIGPWSMIGVPRCQAKDAIIHLQCIQKWPEASEKEMKLLSSCLWEILRLSIVTDVIFKVREGKSTEIPASVTFSHTAMF